MAGESLQDKAYGKAGYAELATMICITLMVMMLGFFLGRSSVRGAPKNIGGTRAARETRAASEAVQSVERAAKASQTQRAIKRNCVKPWFHALSDCTYG